MDSMAWRFVAVAMAMAMVAGVGGDFAADRAECSDKLMDLATCLPYVQDKAGAPTPDCCAGLKKLLQTSRKCLCVLVRDRNDPALGIKFNVTKALGLPASCSASANISECPKLLNLPPNSKEAQIFEQFGKEHGAQGGNSTSGSSAPDSGAQKSSAGPAARWLGVDMVGGGGGGGARAVVMLLVGFSSAAAIVAAPLLLVFL